MPTKNKKNNTHVQYGFLIFMICVYNTLSDWLILGHCFPEMHAHGPIMACQNQAKGHTIKYLLTSNIQSQESVQGESQS